MGLRMTLFVLLGDVSFSDRLRCRETTRPNERTRMRSGLMSRVSSREILDGWHQVLLSNGDPKKSMGWAYYWCILVVVGVHNTMILSSICCRTQVWTILMLLVFGNIHRKSWFLHVFTWFYSEQSRPRNIKHLHMGTLRKGFNGGCCFWGVPSFQ